MSKKKTLLDKAIDAVSTRDEKEAVEEAEKEAATARAQADRQARERKAAEARARTAEAKAAAAEERAQAAEKAAREATSKAARKEREEKMEEIREKARLRAEERRAGSTYVVKSGDSLSKIARELLGDASRWPEIFELNKDEIEDPNLIYPGQEFRIPPK